MGSATNDALPSINPARYLNSFEWFPKDNTGFYLGYPLTNMTYSGTTLGSMTSIMLNSLSYYDYITNSPLPLSENGWDLLLINNGKYPDNTTLNNGSLLFQAMPYIVIYNRYTGTMRIFVNFGLDGNGNDAIQVTTKFNLPQNTSALSGLLRYNAGQDVSLDKKTEVNIVTSIVKAPQFGNAWGSTDVKVAYDPCTCYYPTKLKIDFSTIKISTIKLTGRAVTLENESLIGGGNIVSPNEFLTGFNPAGEDGGLVLHKSMQKMIDNYIQKYDKYNRDLIKAGEHNAKVKTNLTILKVARYAIAAITVVASGGVGTAVSAATTTTAAGPLLYTVIESQSEGEWQDGSVPENDTLYSQIPGTSNTSFINVVENLGKGIIKKEGNIKKIDNQLLFDEVKSILGEKGKLFIANNFETKSIPTSPAIPTASFTEMTFSGSISDTSNIGGPTFYVPGTYGSIGTGSPTITHLYEYPVYNEILGTFALLKSPKIIISSSVENQSNTLKVEKNPYASYLSTMLMNQSWTNAYQFKLAEDLSYAFNSALDIKSSKIAASFDIEATPVFIDEQEQIHSGAEPILKEIQFLFNDKEYSFNTSSNNINIETYSPFIHSGQTYLNPSELMALDADPYMNYPFFIYQPPLYQNFSPKKIQTVSLPIEYFKNTISMVGLKNQYLVKSLAYFGNTNVGFYSGVSDNNGNLPANLNQQCNLYITPSILNPIVKLPIPADPLLNGHKYTFKVKLKLIVDIEFHTVNDNGFNNSTTLIHTYDIDPADIIYQNTAINANLINTVEAQDIPENFYVNTTNFDGTPKTGFKLAGNTYTCDSRNQTIITGNLTTSNGFKAIIRGGNEVVANPETTIDPEIELTINPILQPFFAAMPPIGTTALATYCATTNNSATAYNGNLPTKKVLEYEAKEQALEEARQVKTKLDQPFSFNLFPNPAAQETTIRLINAYNNEATVKVFDITGKELVVEITKTENDLRVLNLATLRAGIYLVKVETYGETQTKQLVVK